MLTLTRTIDLSGGALGLTYADALDNFFGFSGSGSTISRLSSDGAPLATIPRPGESADDFDLDWLTEPVMMGDISVPADTLLAFNGETGPVEIYALDPQNGETIATLATEFGDSHVVGGAYHPGRDTFFVVQDRVPAGTDRDSLIAEIDPATGATLNVIRIADLVQDFSIFYGDLDVEAETGALIVVSSDEDALLIMTPDGNAARIEPFPDGVTGTFSGISNVQGEDDRIFVGTTSGRVFELSGLDADLTPDDLNLVGTPGDDALSGQGGDDVIEGLDGNDTLSGGSGADSLAGGAGDDVLLGDAGDDLIAASDGADFVSGGAGDDSIGGGPGNDTVGGDAGNDTIGAGTGDDEVFGGEGNDVMAGGAGDDLLGGGAGDDTIGGSFGVDSVLGNAGDDSLGGGTGADVLGGGDGSDSIGGGEGNDNVAGDGDADFLAGGGRDDTVDGGTGDDTLNGGTGSDLLVGGAGADLFVWNEVSDGSVDTILDFENGIDRIRLRDVDAAPGSGQQGRLDALEITETEAGVSLRYGTQTIELVDVTADQLGLEDFVFL